jgi:putative pyruvate formate lyase activating enzyme
MEQNYDDILESLRDCVSCPRECHVDRRAGKVGFCNTLDNLAVASVCAHHGEEPVLSGKHGICNIFFSGCNLRCAFCQNYQISQRPVSESESDLSLYDVLRLTERILDSGASSVGFVSPSHVIPQMKVIIAALTDRGRRPTYVFNTNGYDKVETIASLEDTFSVWLPDLKYVDERLGRMCSDAPGYPEIAKAAIKEMHRQVGSSIWLHDDGTIQRGLIIRHLVLPGEVENSKGVLRWIAEELSRSVHISLMSQFHPTANVAGHPTLDRTLTSDEYDEVVAEFERLGFYRGWVQELSSPWHYRPDFDRDHPFET